MVGTDGYGCAWKFADGFEKELGRLPTDGSSVLTEILARYREGRAKPREVKPLGRGLQELRGSVGSNQYRLIFALEGSTAVALHAFVKKTNKLPLRNRRLAERRLADWRRARS